MAEYIERGGKLFPTPFSSEEHGDYRQGWNHCLRAIYQIPAADVVEWKKGHINVDIGGNSFCAECGIQLVTMCLDGTRLVTRPNYCPNCGADLREVTT